MKKGIKSVLTGFPGGNHHGRIQTLRRRILKTIRKAIAEAGFDADDVKATKVGYDGLDACCKKH